VFISKRARIVAQESRQAAEHAYPDASGLGVLGEAEQLVPHGHHKNAAGLEHVLWAKPVFSPAGRAISMHSIGQRIKPFNT
jgi:hypothetical protein